MRIGLIGDPLDPASQLLAASLMQGGAMVVPISRDRLDPGLDRAACASGAAFLASVTDIMAANIPVTLLLRRRTEDEAEDEWRVRLQLINTVLTKSPALDVDLVALCGDAASAIGAFFAQTVHCLPPLQVEAPRTSDATYDVASETICFDDNPARTSDGHTVGWARLRSHARLFAAPSVQNHKADVIAYANAVADPAQPPAPLSEPPMMLFIVVNGVGLGHLTRLLAIAQALRDTERARVVFWCYSRAAGILEAYGFEVIQRMTSKHLKADKAAWEIWEASDLAAFMRAHSPARVVFDGTAVPAALVDAMRMAGTPRTSLAWIRRAMWQEHTDADYLKAAQHCDLVIEPGDLASEVDMGPTTRRQVSHQGVAQFIRVAPVGLVSRGDMLTRREARRELGLRAFGRVCLVSLGGDAFGSNAIVPQLVEETARAAKIDIVWARSPLASTADQPPDGCKTVSVFPLGRYLAAFDGIVSAAGYNSFHEVLGLSDAPVMLVPTLHTTLDDQASRARYAQFKGWSVTLPQSGWSDQRQALSDFWQSVRDRNPKKLPKMPHNDAMKIARILAGELK